MESRFIAALLSGRGSINYNRGIAKIYGVNAAILLGELCFKYDYWTDKGGLTEDGYFFITQEDIEDDTALTPYEQREALKKLKDVVLISKRGLPAKNYYKIDFEMLITCCEKSSYNKLKNLITSDKESLQQEIKNFNTTNKRELIKETNKTSTILEETSSTLFNKISPRKNNNYMAVSSPVDPDVSELCF